MGLNHKFENCCRMFIAMGLYLLLFTSAANAQFLDVNERPKAIRDAIDKKYSELVSSGTSNWSYNGAEKYRMLNLDDDAVVKKMVDDHPEQKVFNLMDVGAGDHSWGKARVKFLNETFPGRDIHFNIFSLTGDNYTDDEPVVRENVNVVEKSEGICTLYKLSAFPVENLIEKMNALGYFAMLSNQVDITVSAYTLMHLVDPVGTYLQIYDLARPQHGLIFVENFFHQGGHDSPLVDDFLRNTKLEFFKRYGGNSFVVRRSDERPARFPYKYSDGVPDSVHPRASYHTLDVDQEYNGPNPKNTLKGLFKDSGSPSLRDSLPFEQ